MYTYKFIQNDEIKQQLLTKIKKKYKSILSEQFTRDYVVKNIKLDLDNGMVSLIIKPEVVDKEYMAELKTFLNQYFGKSGIHDSWNDGSALTDFDKNGERYELYFNYKNIQVIK